MAGTFTLVTAPSLLAWMESSGDDGGQPITLIVITFDAHRLGALHGGAVTSELKLHIV